MSASRKRPTPVRKSNPVKTTAKRAAPAGSSKSKAVGASLPPADASDTSKTARMVAALQHKDGASLADLIALTGWQPHSVRGFLSGTVRKRLGHPLVIESTATGRRYRITEGAAS